MQTYTHFVMTAFYNRRKKDKGETDKPASLPPLVSRATLLGSVMPDLPLIVLSAVFIIWDMVEGNSPGPGGSSHTSYLFGDLFFNDWRVKTVHNIFHAPLLTILYTSIGYFGWRRGKKWGPWLFWFGAACMVHSAIDVAVHYDDGPLLLFPFNMNLRFHSPVSYWDPAHYGTQFAIFEHLLFLAMVGYLCLSWWQRRKERRKTPSAEMATD